MPSHARTVVAKMPQVPSQHPVPPEILLNNVRALALRIRLHLLLEGYIAQHLRSDQLDVTTVDQMIPPFQAMPVSPVILLPSLLLLLLRLHN